jgi:hypothetical protein
MKNEYTNMNWFRLQMLKTEVNREISKVIVIMEATTEQHKCHTIDEFRKKQLSLLKDKRTAINEAIDQKNDNLNKQRILQYGK